MPGKQSHWCPAGVPKLQASLRRGRDFIFGVVAESLQAQEKLLAPCSTGLTFQLCCSILPQLSIIGLRRW